FQSQLIMATAARDAELARGIARDALAGASSVIVNVLRSSPGRCAFDANIMVPLRKSPGDWSAAAAVARELWLGLDADCWLVVAEEYGTSRYNGFWVPLTRQPDVLPGAPAAFHFAVPQALILDDLPPFPVQDEALTGRWRAYLTSGAPTSFSGNMFMSFPV